MKRTWMLTIVGAAIVLAVGVAVALECPVEGLLQKSYDLVDESGEEVGSYSVNFDGYEDDVIMTDELSVSYGGKTVGYQGSVTFSPDADGVMRPAEGSVSTFVEGELCMTGAVTFEEATWRFTGEGLRNKRTGKLIIPPRVYEKDELPLPETLIVFPQALIYLGPILQPETGDQPVVIADFPDDIGAPELITFHSKGRLSRQSFDDEGGFAVELFLTEADPEQFDGNRERLLSRIEYDSQGDVVSAKVFPNWQMVERDEEGIDDAAAEARRAEAEARAAVEEALEALKRELEEAEAADSTEDAPETTDE